jgi:hypothetical protein
VATKRISVDWFDVTFALFAVGALIFTTIDICGSTLVTEHTIVEGKYITPPHNEPIRIGRVPGNAYQKQAFFLGVTLQGRKVNPPIEEETFNAVTAGDTVEIRYLVTTLTNELKIKSIVPLKQ